MREVDGWRSRTERDFAYRSRSSKIDPSSFDDKASRFSLFVAALFGVVVAIVALYSFQRLLRPFESEADTIAQLRMEIARAQSESLAAAETQRNLEKLAVELAEAKGAAAQNEQLRIDVRAAQQRVCKLEEDLRLTRSQRSTYCKVEASQVVPSLRRPASAPSLESSKK